MALLALRIEQEFQQKIPPLTEAEFKQLEENILSDGEVRDPLVIWNGIIVDGHNRWKIIQKHPEIPYKTKEMKFSDKWEAFDWMIKKQLGQRNLTEEQRDYLIGKRYEAQKNMQGGTGANRYTVLQSGQKVQSVDRREQRDGTAGQIGKEYGITDRSVRRDEKYAHGIDAIMEHEPELAESILKSETKVSKRAVRDIGISKPDEQREMIQAVKDGKPIFSRPMKEEKKEEKKESKEEKQKRLDEIRAIKEVAGELFEPPKEIRYTIDSLVKDIENNAVPFIRLFRQIVDGNKELCAVNKGMVIKAIHENVITKIEEIEKEIEDYE